MIHYSRLALTKLLRLERRYADSYLAGVKLQIERAHETPTMIGKPVSGRPHVYRTRFEHTWIFYRAAEEDAITVLNFNDTRQEHGGRFTT